MRSDYLEISCTPAEEDCIQVGKPGARQESVIFKQQLERAFPDCPPGARFAVKGFPHDFGTYYEVCVIYTDEDGADFAFRVENEAPAHWDDTALLALSKLTEAPETARKALARLTTAR
jgi:hypothetical protein